MWHIVLFDIGKCDRGENEERVFRDGCRGD